MDDRDMLVWIHERLEYTHGENPHMDYMHRLRDIILNTEKGPRSASRGACNNSVDLRAILVRRDKKGER